MVRIIHSPERRFSGTGCAPAGVFENRSPFALPRINAAWDIDGEGTNVLRGGYGLFYNRNMGNVEYDNTLRDLIGRCHEEEGSKARHLSQAAVLVRSLYRAGIIRMKRDTKSDYLWAMVAEDLQWLDRSTTDIIGFVARRLGIPMHLQDWLPWELSVRIGSEPTGAREHRARDRRERRQHVH